MLAVTTGVTKLFKSSSVEGLCQTYLAELATTAFALSNISSPPATTLTTGNSQTIIHQRSTSLRKLGNYDQIPQLLAHFENLEFYLVQEFVPDIP